MISEEIPCEIISELETEIDDGYSVYSYSIEQH